MAQYSRVTQARSGDPASAAGSSSVMPFAAEDRELGEAKNVLGARIGEVEEASEQLGVAVAVLRRVRATR